MSTSAVMKKNKSIYKKIIIFILILSLITPISFFVQPNFVQPNKVHAVDFDDAFNAGSFIANTASASANWVSAAADSISASAQTSLVIKEFLLDTIAWGIVNLLIQEMSHSIINWINSGFQGNPAFVTDFGGFLRNIADEKIGEIIEGSDLAFLCDPLDIKFSLALRYATPFKKKVECTLSDVVGNIDDFINGDFGRGGWDGWIELTTKPKNNRYGAYLSSAAELEARIQFSQFEKGKVVEFGRGFLSYEKCDEGPQPQGGGPGAPINCEIVTPGSVIEKQLNSTLGLPAQRLVIADEINEIVAALIGQLLKKVITGVRGLRGVSQRDSSGSSYLDRIRNERSGNDQNAFRDLRGRILDQFNLAVKNETAYLVANQKSLDSVIAATDSITATEGKLVELETCYADKSADGGLNLTTAEKAVAQERMNNASTTHRTLLDNLGSNELTASIAERDLSKVTKDTIETTTNELTNEIAASDSNLTTLVLIRNTVEEATSENDLSVPTNRLSEMMVNRTIHNEPSVIIAEQERDSMVDVMNLLKSTMNTLKQNTEAKIIECNEFPKDMRTSSSSTP
ncbi:MAG: hypothetical protein CMH61_00845 [Nanoarchaeota archaeon]|nr:hypothetical protein [Nanoarchaeota archaeon]|tara:strand:- start:6496 stop:8208 length:1713 start_codon:yes stop_codon:yes gene_type:complete